MKSLASLDEVGEFYKSETLLNLSVPRDRAVADGDRRARRLQRGWRRGLGLHASLPRAPRRGVECRALPRRIREQIQFQGNGGDETRPEASGLVAVSY